MSLGILEIKTGYYLNLASSKQTWSAMNSTQIHPNREMDRKNMRGKSGGVHNFFNYIHLLNTNLIELLCVQYWVL